jgi:hypothetical protein
MLQVVAEPLFGLLMGIIVVAGHDDGVGVEETAIAKAAFLPAIKLPDPRVTFINAVHGAEDGDPVPFFVISIDSLAQIAN